jgi:sortase B
MVSLLSNGAEWFHSLDESDRAWIVTVGLTVAALGPLLLILSQTATQAADISPLITNMPGASSIPTPTITPIDKTEIADQMKKITEEKLEEFKERGILQKFWMLLNANPDVKGWIKIEGTNIDYPVLQPAEGEDPEYYLRRNIFKKEDKCGSIFIDESCALDTKNIVLHGHNMTSTDNMFHYLLQYDKLSFYKDHPTISFDTIYKTGEWKIFAVIKTEGVAKKSGIFDYTISDFKDKSEFLNFIYQLRERSIYDLPVDINQKDKILMLSTCSYEIKNYRTVIIARRIREGEDSDVAVDKAKKNKNPLYPAGWYIKFGGDPPILTSFEKALETGEITWYNPAP